MEFDRAFLFAMKPVWIWAAPADRIFSCTLCTDAVGHTITMLNMVISLLKFICMAISTVVLMSASMSYIKKMIDKKTIVLVLIVLCKLYTVIPTLLHSAAMVLR